MLDKSAQSSSLLRDADTQKWTARKKKSLSVKVAHGGECVSRLMIPSRRVTTPKLTVVLLQRQADPAAASPHHTVFAWWPLTDAIDLRLSRHPGDSALPSSAAQQHSPFFGAHSLCSLRGSVVLAFRCLKPRFHYTAIHWLLLCTEHTGWPWRNFFVPYLCQLFRRHDGKHWYFDIVFLVT